MKYKMKKIVLMIAIIGLVIIGINFSNVQAAVIDKENNRAEIFNEDIDTIRNWTKVPANLFSYDGLTLWCMQSGVHFDPHMTASQSYYNAYFAEETGKEFEGIDATFYLNEDGDFIGRGIKYNKAPSVFKYYNNSESIGLITNHRDYYSYFLSKIRTINLGYSPYDGDDSLVISRIENEESGLPGIGTNIVQSIEYTQGEMIKSEENQDALYILTAMPIYEGDIPLQPENLTNEQKQKGYFTVKEKQYALWESGITYLRPSAHIEYVNEDRNLGDIARKYKEFYASIHSDKTYSDYIEVSNGYDKNGNAKKDNIKETKISIGDKEYNTYVYEDTLVEIDVKNQAYILGPYYIDYSIDDENIDVYYTTDNYEIKYNSIENITVYNQNKVDITTLGGYFKIAYSYDGTLTDKNEGKIVRINDKEYYEMADGKEVSGFDSRKEFYIIVYRGEMDAEDFRGFYAKIDLQYLEHIEGTLQMYVGNVYNYYYTREQGTDHNFTYGQSFKRYVIVGYINVPIYNKERKNYWI